jgi:hypothetical protein
MLIYSEIATNLVEPLGMKRMKVNWFVFFFGGCLIAITPDINAQNIPSRQSEKSFYYLPELQLVASQLDGDNAAGYNKFGFLAQFNVGWKQNQSQSFELSVGFAERGSRRAYNPDVPSLNPFHIRYRSVESAVLYNVALSKLLPSWDIPLDLQAGLRVGRILQIEDTERYALFLEDVYRPWTGSIELGARYSMNEHWAISARMNYSAISMLREGQSNNPIFPTGVYNNAIGLGVIYIP